MSYQTTVRIDGLSYIVRHDGQVLDLANDAWIGEVYRRRWGGWMARRPDGYPEECRTRREGIEWLIEQATRLPALRTFILRGGRHIP